MRTVRDNVRNITNVTVCIVLFRTNILKQKCKQSHIRKAETRKDAVNYAINYAQCNHFRNNQFLVPFATESKGRQFMTHFSAIIKNDIGKTEQISIMQNSGGSQPPQGVFLLQKTKAIAAGN